MALTNTDSLKTFLGISLADTSKDTQLALYVQAADAIIKSYCKRNLESASYTEYYDGNGTPNVILRQRPVTTLTSVYLDPTGYYGRGPSAFAASTLLTDGQDYVLKLEGGARGNSGLVIRLGGGTGGWDRDWDYPASGRRGTLSARFPPAWTPGYGNLKITFTAGYLVVPADLQDAANMLAAWIRTSGPIGAALTSEQIGRYSYQLASRDAALSTDLAGIKTILTSYREISA